MALIIVYKISSIKVNGFDYCLYKISTIRVNDFDLCLYEV